MGAFAGNSVDKDDIRHRGRLCQRPDDGQVGKFTALVALVIKHAGSLPGRAKRINDIENIERVARRAEDDDTLAVQGLIAAFSAPTT